MQRDYREYIQSCPVCQLHRHTDRIPQNPLYPLAPPGVPFHTWGLDFIQDLPLSQKGNTNIITAICHATKWTVAQAVPDRSTKTVAKFLFQLMLKFGAPTKIITDRASSFLSRALQDYLDLLSIHHYPSTPYHPQTNGAVERMHGVLEPILEKMAGPLVVKWDEFL